MAGWLILTGRTEDVEPRLPHFRSTFAVAGVPPLCTTLHSVGPSVHVLLWAWSPLTSVDLTCAWSADRTELLLLDGYLAGGDELPDAQRTTASLLARWTCNRVDALRRLSGSFAVAHIDGSRGEYAVATDRIASRPVWFFEDGAGVIAGNAPVALATAGRRAPTLNPAGLWALFAAARPVGRQGLYTGMRSLRGGELLTVRSRPCRVQHRHWHEERYQKEQRTPREWGEAIGEALMRSSARVAAVTPAPNVFLSGGLDSRLTAAAMGGRATAVTLTSSGRNMNVRIARRVAARVGATHLIIERTDHWYLDSFPAAALMAGGNYSLRHAHYVVPVQMIRAARPDAAFLLGDMLENFNKHYFKPLNGAIPAFVPIGIPQLFPRLFAYAHPQPERLRRLFRPEIVGLLEESWREELARFCAELRDVSDDDSDCFDMLFRWSHCGLCPTYLMLECIRPLASERNLMCDNELLDLYFTVPAAVRGAGVLHRETLRFFGRGLSRIPDSNYWLPPGAPQPLRTAVRRARPVIGRWRRRIRSLGRRTGAVVATEGSWHMLAEWYRRDARHRAFIEECLVDTTCLPPEIFDVDAIAALWSDFSSGAAPDPKAAAFELDALLAFGVLHRQVPTGGLSRG